MQIKRQITPHMEAVADVTLTKDIMISTHVHRGERGTAFCRLPDLHAVEIATLPGHALRGGVRGDEGGAQIERHL